MNDPAVINAFVRAALEMFEAELQVTIERGPVSVTTPDAPGMPMIGIIGVTGELEGIVSLGVMRETACAIAGSLMGEEITEVNALVESALGEMCNVVAGRAAALMHEQAIRIDITPPVIIMGDALKLSMGGVPRVTVPFVTPLGQVEMKIAYHAKTSASQPSALQVAARI